MYRIANQLTDKIIKQELRPVLESMAGLIGCKVWYVTEKGELEVVPKVLEAEQREMGEMRALMDAGNHTGALAIYQGRYKRFAKNPPPPQQTALAFEVKPCVSKLSRQSASFGLVWFDAPTRGCHWLRST